MSEEDLELLITLDDPEGAPEEDRFNHLRGENTPEYWLVSQAPRAEAVGQNNRKNKV